MKQNGVVCEPGPLHLFFIFRFEYLISGPKSYRDVRETSPRYENGRLEKDTYFLLVRSGGTPPKRFTKSNPRELQVSKFFIAREVSKNSSEGTFRTLGQLSARTVHGLYKSSLLPHYIKRISKYRETLLYLFRTSNLFAV